MNGEKDIIGILPDTVKIKEDWQKYFENMKELHGIEDILFVCTSEIPDLENAATKTFNETIIQRNILSLIHNNSYVEEADKYIEQFNKIIYGASNLKAAEKEFELFKQNWNGYPITDACIANWDYIKKLFDYDISIRKIIYEAKAINSLTSVCQKIADNGPFHSFKAFREALRKPVTKLYQKWNKLPPENWPEIRAELEKDDNIKSRISKYEQAQAPSSQQPSQ